MKTSEHNGDAESNFILKEGKRGKKQREFGSPKNAWQFAASPRHGAQIYANNLHMVAMAYILLLSEITKSSESSQQSHCQMH